MLRKENLQLTELQLYINNIESFLVIMDILSARMQDNQLNTIIKCSTIFKIRLSKDHNNIQLASVI